MNGGACGGPDLVPYVYEAVGQIPRGRVATYGDIAVALGDRVAARAVGEVLSSYPGPPGAPKHRVVRSTGEVRDEESSRALEAEGLAVVNGSVTDMGSARFSEFLVKPVLAELRAEQNGIKDRVIGKDDFGELLHVAGLDVSYRGHRAYGALAVHDALTGAPIGERIAECMVRFPYIPSYLTYRELPALRPLVTESSGTIYLVDGHGALHPRGAGVASHIGVTLNVPTVGAAKSALVGEVLEPVNGRAAIMLDGKVKGCRIGDGRHATYVSIGHRVSLETAVEVCERLLVKGIPCPLRRAHDLAGRARRASA